MHRRMLQTGCGNCSSVCGSLSNKDEDAPPPRRGALNGSPFFLRAGSVGLVFGAYRMTSLTGLLLLILTGRTAVGIADAHTDVTQRRRDGATNPKLQVQPPRTPED